jgi:hypothetical protein
MAGALIKLRILRYLSLLPMWEFDNVMKISTGEAMWELIYTDRWMDGGTDVVKLSSLSDCAINRVTQRMLPFTLKY